jgi:SH3-like domain-containing protein
VISASPRYLGITLLIIAASAIIFSQTAWASPGEKIYVQKPSVNIRTGPGTNNAVLLKLNLGHELIEFSRRGEWINVGIPRTGGKDGWIHSSLVGPVSPGGATTAPKDRRFDAFLKDVEKLNAKVEPITGFPFFTKVENLGDGIVQLTAHDQWLKAPRSDRESNLNTLYRLWSAQEGSGLPVAVYIVDARSNLVIKKASP